MNDHECCGNCRYFESASRECHRRSPVYIVQQDSYRDGTKINVAIWPPVKSRRCWCGEWEGVFEDHANKVRISESRLSTRAKKLLRIMGARTIGDASQLNERRLLATRNLGRTTLKEIKVMLAGHGMTLSKEHQDE